MAYCNCRLSYYHLAFAGVPSLELKSKSLEILKSIFSGLFHPDISYIYIPDVEDLLRGLLGNLCDSRCRYFHRRNYLYSISILGANNMVKATPSFRC